MSCVVPGCKSGYGTDNKIDPGVSLHRFPKDPELKKKWCSAIPRANWEPSDYSRICSLHFDASDYYNEHHDSNKYRKTGPELIKKRLTPEAVPRYFHGCPSYLSSTKPLQRSETSTLESRRQRAAETLDKKAEEFLKADTVSDFQSLMQNFSSLVFQSSWNIVTLKLQDKVVIEGADFDEDGLPSLRFSLTIHSGLDFSLFVGKAAIPASKVKSIAETCRIERLSDVENILAFLNAYSSQEPDPKDVVEDCITKLSRLAKQTVVKDDVLSQKLEFLGEQLSLALMPANSRRYSSKLLWHCLTWMKTGPALYKLMLSEGLFTLPSTSRLHRLSSAFSLETGFSTTTSSYLSERIKHLSPQERLVSLQIDEVYTSQRVDYSGGSYFGSEDERPTRTLLSFLVSSIAGSYSDLVCFLPVVTLDSPTLMKHFLKVAQELEKLDFRVLVVITDGHKTNVKLFVELSGGQIKTRIPHPFASHPLFLLFDPVHLMKNFFNGFQRKRFFLFPNFSGGSDLELKTANFNHLIELYELELVMPVKLAYRLSHRVLFPGPIERQSVQLTSSVFHESTVEALRYYSRRGHPEFEGTATFIDIILQWWKLVNSKSTFLATKLRDPHREAITASNLVDKCSFLRGFVDWLSEWERQSGTERGLSSETFQAARHSSECLASVFEYLIKKANVQYVLPIKLQNDKIESRFGRLRQMCGGNLFTSTRQFLESERSIRMMNLARLNLDSDQMADLFREANEEADINSQQAALEIVKVVVLQHDISMVPDIPEADRDALLYVSGCFARQVSKSTSCISCKNVILLGDADIYDQVMQGTSFLAQVNRGGLTVPSEMAFLTCIHAWSFYLKVVHDPELKKILLSSNLSSRKIFVLSFTNFLQTSDETRLTFIEQCCEKGHKFDKHLKIFASKCFNIFSKNYVSVINSSIHENRKRSSNAEAKRESSNYKSLKLQSERF